MPIPKVGSAHDPCCDESEFVVVHLGRTLSRRYPLSVLVVDKYIVGVSKRGEEVSMATFACFSEAPDILGINCLIQLFMCPSPFGVSDCVPEVVGG